MDAGSQDQLDAEAARNQLLTACLGRARGMEKFALLAAFLFIRSYYYLRVVVAPAVGWQ
jgi:hypothetical protein